LFFTDLVSAFKKNLCPGDPELQEVQNTLIPSWPTPPHWAAKERAGRLPPWQSFAVGGLESLSEAAAPNRNEATAKEWSCQPPEPCTLVRSKAGQGVTLDHAVQRCCSVLMEGGMFARPRGKLGCPLLTEKASSAKAPQMF